MNLPPVQFLNKKSQNGGIRFARLIAVMLALFLLTAVPVAADPITANQVVQTYSSSTGALDLRLTSLVSQDPQKKGGTPNGPRNDQAAQGQGGTSSESPISGVAITGEGQQLGVDIVEEGEVEGTICDCGEIPVAAGAFPKWPFLFLAAVPLIFINNCDDCEEQTQESPTPTPTPTPTPPSVPTPTPTPPGVPEPGSLFLLGTGLAAASAGIRRRYTKMKAGQQTKEEE